MAMFRGRWAMDGTPGHRSGVARGVGDGGFSLGHPFPFGIYFLPPVVHMMEVADG